MLDDLTTKQKVLVACIVMVISLIGAVFLGVLNSRAPHESIDQPPAQAVAANDPVAFAQAERKRAREAQAVAASPAPKSPLGGEVDRYADRFNAAARKYESTIRMRAAGCVRETMVTCTYMVGNIGVIAAADHGKPLATLMFVAGSDGDPVDLVMSGVLTMAVFAPTASRQAIQASFNQLIKAYAADNDHRGEIVFEGVAYRLANTPLGVLLTVMRSVN